MSINFAESQRSCLTLHGHDGTVLPRQVAAAAVGAAGGRGGGQTNSGKAAASRKARARGLDCRVIDLGVSKNRGKTPQIMNLNRVFHYKLSILGYPYSWKHSFGPESSRQTLVETNI